MSVSLCARISSGKSLRRQRAEEYELAELPKPKEIAETLAQYVIGQDSAKNLAVAVYNHYKENQQRGCDG